MLFCNFHANTGAAVAFSFVRVLSEINERAIICARLISASGCPIANRNKMRALEMCGEGGGDDANAFVVAGMEAGQPPRTASAAAAAAAAAAVMMGIKYPPAVAQRDTADIDETATIEDGNADDNDEEDDDDCNVARTTARLDVARDNRATGADNAPAGDKGDDDGAKASAARRSHSAAAAAGSCINAINTPTSHASAFNLQATEGREGADEVDENGDRLDGSRRGKRDEIRVGGEQRMNECNDLRPN